MLEFKRDPRQKRATSVDGFTHRPVPVSRVPRVDNFKSRGTVSGIGNFRQPEGLQPNQNPAMLSNLQRPIPQRQLSDRPRRQAARPEQASKPPKPPKKHGRKLRILKKSALVLCSILFLLSGFFVLKTWLVSRNIFKGGGSALALNKNIDPSKLNGEGDGRVNVLVMGKGGKNHPGGELTDTILVASINPIGKEAVLLSIPRDLWVQPKGFGAMKINAVYNTGKEEALSDGKSAADAEKIGVSTIEQTIENYLGISIHYYVSVDFDAYKKAVDTVGGIDITLDNAIYDPNFDWEYGRNALKLPAGKVHLSGTQALLLGRSRGAAGGYGVVSDFDRNENQRKMIIALREKVFTLGTFGNPAKINDLLNAFSQNVKSNFNGVADVLRLYNIFKDIPGSSIKSLSFVDPPNVLITTGNINGQSVVMPKAGLTDFSAIKAFVRSNLIDGYLKNENASVVVLNGTAKAGLATAKAEELKSYGYNVSTVDSAPTNDYERTILIDRTGGTKKYTKRYLEQRLGVSAQSNEPNKDLSKFTGDFVIILGSK